jgi:hypothetical protein
MSLLKNLLIGLAAGLFFALLYAAGVINPLSGGFFGIVDYRYLGKRRVPDGIDDLLKTAGNIAAIGNFTALIANLGWYVFNDDDTVVYIRGKRGKTVQRFAFTHKTGHFASSRRVRKSADHSAGFGMYAVISHNSEPPEPQTMCRYLSSRANPKTRQLGKG